MSLRVAIVCPDQELQMAAARAFDAAPGDWELGLHPEPIEEADVLVAVGCEVPGAVPMDLSRPGDALAEIARRSSRRRLIAVVGASGGCGATSVLLHLAAARARRERTAAVELGRGPEALARLGVDADGLPPDRPDPFVLPVPGGFRLVSSRTGAIDAEAAIEMAFEGAACVLVGLPHEDLAGWQPPLFRALIVMTPSRPSARKAAALMGERPDLPWVPVTNRVGPGSEMTRVDIERILDRRVALELPCSPGLRDAEDDLKLLTSPLSPWRMRIQRLSEAL